MANTRCPTSVATKCSTSSGRRRSMKHSAKRPTSRIARSVAPKSSAPASDVIAPPSNPATTARPSTAAKSNNSALHSVGIGALLESPRSRSRKTTFADSALRSVKLCEISGLAMSQPAVSEAVSNLEHLLGVRLLDRSPRGIEPTIYADAMLKRTVAVFDELQQGVRDIRSLADPTTGELTIGYSNMIAATVFPKIIKRFSAKYPRVVMHVDLLPSPSNKFLPGLRDRTFDLIFARLSTQVTDDPLMDDVNMEFLFEDPLVVVAGRHSPWARRRKIELADLIGEPWILSPPKTWSYERVAEAFKARGLGMPTASLLTYSMDIRAKLSVQCRFITVVQS